MRKRKKLLLAVLLGVLLSATGCRDEAISFTPALQQDSEEDIQSREAAQNRQEMTEEATKGEQAGFLYVYVCGAVQKPGVVELAEGSRAEAAIAAAGGFTREADEESVNLAAKVTDEQMLYVPTKEEAEALRLESQNTQSKQVNINTASEEQLCTLPGIGASRAKDIIAYREAHGQFADKEDIMKVSGIKESLYSKISEWITVQ